MIKLASIDAGKALNSTPLVEPNSAGGHVPYVRQDTTPTTDYPAADAVQIAILTEIREHLREIRLEVTATRLAAQERINEGNTTQHDFREMAQSLIDAADTEEP